MGCRTLLALIGSLLIGTAVPTRGEESLEQRSTRLAALPPGEIEELRTKKEQFDRLPPEERARLRDLHRQLCQQPDAEKLREVMIRYSEWLKSLPSDQRSELAALDATQRLQQIKRVLEQQERQRFQELVFRKLDPRDYEVIKKWFSALVQRKVKSLGETLPPEAREQISRRSDPMDLLMEIARIRREMPGEKKDARPLDYLDISEADVAELNRALSPEASRTLADVPDNNDKLTLVRGWVLAAAFSGRWHRVSDEELKKFLATRDAATRDHLEDLPREEMFKELRRLYYTEHMRSRWPPRGGPGGPGPPPPWSPGFDPSRKRSRDSRPDQER
jgi:hypothetical protein